MNTSITATTAKHGIQKHNGHFNLSATFSRNTSFLLKQERRSFVASCLLIFERFVVKYDARPRNRGIFKSLGDVLDFKIDSYTNLLYQMLSTWLSEFRNLHGRVFVVGDARTNLCSNGCRSFESCSSLMRK